MHMSLYFYTILLMQINIGSPVIVIEIVGEIVSFNNLTNNATSVEWNIADITSINGVNNATYTFDEAGTYVIELNVASDDCSDSKSFTVNVSNKTTSVTTLDSDNALRVFANKNTVVLEFLNSYSNLYYESYDY